MQNFMQWSHTALCISPWKPKCFRCRSIWVWLWCGIKFVTTSCLPAITVPSYLSGFVGQCSTRRLYPAIRQILSSNFRVPDIGSMKATLQITVHSVEGEDSKEWKWLSNSHTCTCRVNVPHLIDQYYIILTRSTMSNACLRDCDYLTWVFWLPALTNSKMAPCILATPLSGALLELNCPMTIIQYKYYCYAHNADNQRVTFCLWPIWAPHHCHTQIEQKPEDFHFQGLMQRV